ncbi:MAG: hypothetical protein ACK41P_09050 [Asticcacaulis sp.]
MGSIALFPTRVTAKARDAAHKADHAGFLQNPGNVIAIHKLEPALSEKPLPLFRSRRQITPGFSKTRAT